MKSQLFTVTLIRSKLAVDSKGTKEEHRLAAGYSENDIIQSENRESLLVYTTDSA